MNEITKIKLRGRCMNHRKWEFGCKACRQALADKVHHQMDVLAVKAKRTQEEPSNQRVH